MDRYGRRMLIALVMTAVVGACSPGNEPTVPPGGADLTMLVRNASDAEAHITIQLGPDGGAEKGVGFGRTVGISCNVIPSGSRVLLKDRGPDDGTEPQVKAVVFEATGAEIRPVRWLDIDATGHATVGQGVPEWWSGAPSC